MSITRNFNLYLNAGHSIPLVINASQYDQGEIWNFTIYNSDGTQYTPTDASIVGKKSDGNLIAIAATVSDGIVSVTETQQMTAAAGKNLFELQIDSLTHGTANFVVLVEADPTEDGVVSESALSLIDQAINGGINSTVRQAIYNLFDAAAYADADVSTDLATVQAWASEVTAISLDQSAITISGSGTVQLTATTTPSGGAVSWTSSDSTIATVDSTGLVTGVANGTVTITATSGNYSATCTATISGFATLTSISAVYSGGSVVEGTALDDLKTDLVVTATYDDSSTATIASADYTLSGTLTEGTCTVTVTYGGQTTTFTVTVTDASTVYSLSNWVSDENSGTVTTDLYFFGGTDRDFSITCDCIWGTQSDGVQWTLFYAMNAVGPYAGLAFRRNGTAGTTILARYGTQNNTSLAMPAAYTGRTLILVNHISGSGKTYFYIKKAGDESYSVESCTSSFPNVTQPFRLCGNSTDEQRWLGTITDFKFKSVSMSDDEITAFFA